MSKQQNENWGLGRLFSFMLRVLRGFKRNQGLLLSGAVAYNTLLSIVPMSIIGLIVLSHFIEEEQLFYTLSMYFEMLIPGYAATLADQVRVFLEHRKVVGMIGFPIMLFFSSIAFMVLENAMSVSTLRAWMHKPSGKSGRRPRSQIKLSRSPQNIPQYIEVPPNIEVKQIVS